MAEYYPLLSRAVAALRDGAPEARQAIYGRARQALIGQLRGMQPPVPEEAITKEITALDEAIARIEAEIVPPPSVSDAASAAVEAALLFEAPPSPVAPVALPPEVTAISREPAPLDAAPQIPAVAVRPPASRPVAPTSPRVPASAARDAAPPMLRADRPVFTPRPSLPAARQARPGAPDLVEKPPALPVEVAPDVAPSALPTAPTLESALDRRSDALVVPTTTPDAALAAAEGSASPEVVAEAPLVDARGRDEAVRPAMPRQTAAQPRNLRVWIVAVAALAAVVVIALTAWKLRDKPEELVRLPTPAPKADSTPGKIVERADGAAPTEDEPDAAPAATTAAGSAPQAAATPVPVPGAGTAAQPASDQAIPVSYKAAVLVAAPDTPEKVRTFVGSVIWRMEGSTSDPATLAVRADVDLPEAKLQMTMEIRRNSEAQFPASHTIDIKFTPQPGNDIGNVKQIDVPQMRREDAPTGDPLVGVPVTITNNSFLVGLTRGDAEARNLDAMRTRGWFDIPMVLEDGKPAKITFEKGASGDRILADALTAWGKN